jgi:hypothetical protein
VPSLELIVLPPDVRNLPVDGNLPLDPPFPGLDRVLLRRLQCWLRVPPIPGAHDAVLDTGAPLTVFPHTLWNHQFRWQAGRDYDELSVAGVGTVQQGQVLGHRELAGRNPRGDRLRLDGLVCQLADRGSPPYVILGLWGGVFEGRRLAVERLPASDDLAARLEF